MDDQASHPKFYLLLAQWVGPRPRHVLAKNYAWLGLAPLRALQRLVERLSEGVVAERVTGSRYGDVLGAQRHLLHRHHLA
jgi:hypothetical protein